jgi:molybdopterin molybdotransferase
MISFDEAYKLTLQHIRALDVEIVDLIAADGYVAGEDFLARADSPSLDVSSKDGYAILSADIQSASPESPVRLNLVGSVAAGGNWRGIVQSGEAVRILSGAPLPQGASAVVSEEFTQALPGAIRVINDAEPGRNVLPRGSDVKVGQRIVPAGQRLHPTTIGLLAAAGYQEVPVTRRPKVAILATGDEVLAPGQPLVQGKLYASNLFTLAAWCSHFGFRVETFILQDDTTCIRDVLAACPEQFDAVLTSGGAWKGEHDLIVKILDSLGWQKIYHRVRMGPGKAVGFGLFRDKPVFCLPGGPPSCHMAFIQLGLPGLQKLAGNSQLGLPEAPAIMDKDIVSNDPTWTQFIHGQLVQENHRLLFHPIKYKSRLQELAQAQAIAKIPEGQGKLLAGSTAMVQVLRKP